MNENTHRTLRESIRARIAAGEWPPNSIIPAEVDLAEEYGCSRTTVNRAMQSLADDGLIERKRRAGTRVKETPDRHARFKIPLIRHEVEAAGAHYEHHILLREVVAAPRHVLTKLRLPEGERALHLQTVHMADGRPYAFEDRWVNIKAAPEILSAPLDTISANEWLLRQVPYSSGAVVFSASEAGPMEAGALDAPAGAALFTVDRTTQHGDQHITVMRLYYRPGYQMRTQL